jgi:uncharacterized protein
MRLYSGTTTTLAEDSAHNRIAGKLRDAFFRELRYEPSLSEVSSWRNSLRALSQAFQLGSLNDHGVLIEYQLPQTSKRLDCIVTGRDLDRRDQAVVVELKQWERCLFGLDRHFGPIMLLHRFYSRGMSTLHRFTNIGIRDFLGQRLQ